MEIVWAGRRSTASNPLIGRGLGHMPELGEGRGGFMVARRPTLRGRIRDGAGRPVVTWPQG